MWILVSVVLIPLKLTLQTLSPPFSLTAAAVTCIDTSSVVGELKRLGAMEVNNADTTNTIGDGETKQQDEQDKSEQVLVAEAKDKKKFSSQQEEEESYADMVRKLYSALGPVIRIADDQQQKKQQQQQHNQQK